MSGQQVQEAEQRFSEVVQRVVNEEPEVVPRHGEDMTVVIDKGDAPDFGKSLLADPDWDDDVEFSRKQDLPRKVDLD
ncbi:prevent-host-death protein [Streptosporangium sp. NPDC049644]|uniref:prevent-host-death protein n=1 Tax=Streptosporangium sp. NPDC049644 TaxID=3155507 RepID=UPI00341C0103